MKQKIKGLISVRVLKKWFASQGLKEDDVEHLFDKVYDDIESGVYCGTDTDELLQQVIHNAESHGKISSKIGNILLGIFITKLFGIIFYEIKGCVVRTNISDSMPVVKFKRKIITDFVSVTGGEKPEWIDERYPCLECAGIFSDTSASSLETAIRGCLSVMELANEPDSLGHVDGIADMLF